MMLHGAVKHPAFGDKKYSARVNPNTRRTKALGLSIVPTRVDRRDAKRVFQTVWKTLLFLESKDRNQCYLTFMFGFEARLFCSGTSLVACSQRSNFSWCGRARSGASLFSVALGRRTA